MSRVRVLVVDDSPLMRKLLKQTLTLSQDFEVVGTAADPFEARDLIVDLKPDLVTLDLDMPKMDGLTFLEKLMSSKPTRVVILSSRAGQGSRAALQALELGAIDVIEKPSFEILRDPVALAEKLFDKLRNAARAHLAARARAPRATSSAASPDLNPHVHMIAIASSTGGTEALKVVLNELPAKFPPILIVQHMPPGFTKTYAANLSKRYPFEVREAQEGDRLTENKVYIAPGDYHMEIRKAPGGYAVHLHQSEPIHGVRPAADYLLESVAKIAKSHALGAVLTGMGRDGAKGLLAMKNQGAFTISQSEKTCVVYGMPAAAVALQAVSQVVDLDEVTPTLLKKFAAERKGAA